MGFRIKETRERIGISQSELADKSGVSRTIISALENGSRTVTTTKTLCKIADAMGVTVDEIFTVFPTTDA